jgi:hypothetical protein
LREWTTHSVANRRKNEERAQVRSLD